MGLASSLTEHVSFCSSDKKNAGNVIHRLLALLFVAGGAFAFPRSAAGCEFPREWEGIWFQSTVRPYIAIAGAEMSGKGDCVERDRAGEKYILRA